MCPSLFHNDKRGGGRHAEKTVQSHPERRHKERSWASADDPLCNPPTARGSREMNLVPSTTGYVPSKLQQGSRARRSESPPRSLIGSDPTKPFAGSISSPLCEAGVFRYSRAPPLGPSVLFDSRPLPLTRHFAPKASRSTPFLRLRPSGLFGGLSHRSALRCDCRHLEHGGLCQVPMDVPADLGVISPGHKAPWGPDSS